MTNRIVIYGDTEFAGQVKYSLDHDSDFKVEAFTVHRDFRNVDLFNDLPVVNFEEVIKKYPPKDFQMFVAIGYKKMNSLRSEIITLATKSGYNLINFIASSAVCKAHKLGMNIFIDDLCCIGEGVTIDDGCIINIGANIGHRSSIGKNNFIAGSASIAGNVTIEDNCYVGNNATIANGLVVSKQSFIGAATYLNKSTESYRVYSGNPAKKYNIDSMLAEESFL